MHIRNNLGAIDWGSLATNLITSGVGYKLNTLQSKREESNRRAAELSARQAEARQAAEAARYAPVNAHGNSPVFSSTPLKKITSALSSPMVILGAAGALGLALFLMRRSK